MIKFDKNETSYSICDNWDNKKNASPPKASSHSKAVHASQYEAFDQFNKLPDGYNRISIKPKNKITSRRNTITNIKLTVPYTPLS